MAGLRSQLARNVRVVLAPLDAGSIGVLIEEATAGDSPGVATAPPQPAATEESGSVDVAALLEEVLEKQRHRIHERRVVVLTELDPGRPRARGDEAQLRLAFESLLDACLELVAERGDLYLATRRHESGLRGQPCVRVLLRTAGTGAGRAAVSDAPAFALAERVVRAQGGSLALDTGEHHAAVAVLDLPA